MALIDKETIRKEIERRIENCVKNVNHRPCHRIEELCELLSFLDALPEQPVEGLDTTEDFVEEVRQYYSNNCTWDALKQPMLSIITRCARHFYEFAEGHAMLAGMNKMKEQMMEKAVEGEICGRVYDHINVRFADGICKHLEPKNISHIPADVSKFKVGDKVKVIVIPE